jgi:hypothetical protein
VPANHGGDRWLLDDVQPAAKPGSASRWSRQADFVLCRRSINSQPGAKTSEHAYGNALDVAAYRFASGHEVTVKDGWRGRPEERGFLRQIHAAACQRFSTVLGPGADAFHYDHFHLDLARALRSVCNGAAGSAEPESFRTAQRAPWRRRSLVRPMPAPAPGLRPCRAAPQPDTLFSNRSLAELPPSAHCLPPPNAAGTERRTQRSRSAIHSTSHRHGRRSSGTSSELLDCRSSRNPRPACVARIGSSAGVRSAVTGSVDARKFYADAWRWARSAGRDAGED